MTGPRPSERVCNLMQQHLVDLVERILCCEIPGHGDAALREIAQAGSSFCVVEPKMPACSPAHSAAQMLVDEALGESCDFVKFGHEGGLFLSYRQRYPAAVAGCLRPSSR